MRLLIITGYYHSVIIISDLAFISRRILICCCETCKRIHQFVAMRRLKNLENVYEISIVSLYIKKSRHLGLKFEVKY